MKLKNKLLILLITIILLIILLSSNVFAAETENFNLSNKSDYDIIINFDTFSLNYDELTYRALLYDKESNIYYFYASDDVFSIRNKTTDDILELQNYNSSIVLELGQNNTTLFDCRLSNSDFIIDDDAKTITLNSNSGAGKTDVNLIRAKNNGLKEIALYRNDAWLTDYTGIDTSIFQHVGNTIFSGSNSSVIEENTSILAPIIEDTTTDDVFSEIFLILPVCLLAIIVFIATRKGISFIKNFLHKA